MAGQRMMIDQVGVAMSPQHFKTFCLAANATLEAYERVFGELKIPESDLQPSHNADQLEKMLQDAREKGAAARSAMVSSPTEKEPPAKRSRAARKGKAH